MIRNLRIEYEPPTPTKPVGQDTPEERSSDACDTKHCSSETKVSGLFRRSDDVGHYDIDATQDAGPSQPGDCSSCDECGTGFCNGYPQCQHRQSLQAGDHGPTTSQAPEFEDYDGRKKGPFQRKVFVRLAPKRLKGGKRHEKCGGIPTDLIEAMELIGDARNGGGDNSLLRASDTDIDTPIEELLR